MILHAIMILVEDTRYGKCVDEDSSPFLVHQRGMWKKFRSWEHPAEGSV